MFFVPSQVLISRTDSWKLSAQTWQNCLLISCFQKLAGDFWNSVSFPFLLLLTISKKKKTLNFANMICLKPYIENETKTQKSLALFCRPRLPLHVSKKLVYVLKLRSICITGWATYNSWLAFWSFKGDSCWWCSTQKYRKPFRDALENQYQSYKFTTTENFHIPLSSAFS